MLRICLSLASSGFKVTLVGRIHDKEKKIIERPYQQEIIKCFFSKGKLMYLEYNLRLFFFLLSKSPDAITAIDLDSILPCYLISVLKKIPRIYDAHELFTEMKEVITRPFIYRSWLALEQRMVPKFPIGYTVSASIANEFERRYRVHYEVIMNTPLLSNQGTEKTNSGQYILYQGAVNEGRGLEWLIPAMANVNAVLWICGEGNFSGSCRKLIMEYGLEKRVLMKGILLPDELSIVANDAYLGLNLVEPLGLNQMYSLANKFFDYIHAGIPQLTMDFPEYRAINEKFEVALLIDMLNAEKIAGALNNLLQNEVLYRRLQSNCRKAAEEYNWQHEEKKLAEIYNKIFN